MRVVLLYCCTVFVTGTLAITGTVNGTINVGTVNVTLLPMQ